MNKVISNDGTPIVFDITGGAGHEPSFWWTVQEEIGHLDPM